MKKIDIGFVGAGWMGSVQLQRLKARNDVEVLALLEPNKQRGEEVLKAVGLSPSLLVSDYDQIINNPAIDAVWLVSPNSFHGPQSIKAMQAGKHVFCEKPCATSFGDFCRQIELEKSNPKVFTFVDYLMNFDTMEDRLRTMVAAGDFGQITQIQVNYRHPVNIAGDKVWKLSREIMGDAIGMGIIHSISVMVNVMSSQAKPAAVYATSMSARVRGFEADPIWNIMVHFDNGSTGFCFGNIDSGNGYDAFHSLYGTEGAFAFDSQQDRPNKVRYWSVKSTHGKWIFPLNSQQCKSQMLEECVWPDDTTTPDSGNVVEHQTGAAVGHFIDCVKNKTKSPLSFANSSIIAEIGWAAQMSAATGEMIPLPLDWSRARTFFESH
jgi:predicted dehydrogenase